MIEQATQDLADRLNAAKTDSEYTKLCAELASAITLPQYDELGHLAKNGPVHDGDVTSKALRDDLLALNLASRAVVKGAEGYTVANYRGGRVHAAKRVSHYMTANRAACGKSGGTMANRIAAVGCEECRKIYASTGDKSDRVRDLGDAIGYGNMMDVASKVWASQVGGGAFSVGPCLAELVPCPCPDSEKTNGHCDVCCGAHMIVKRVRDMLQERETIRSLLA